MLSGMAGRSVAHGRSAHRSRDRSAHALCDARAVAGASRSARRSALASSALEDDLVAALDPDRRSTPRARRDALLVARESVLVCEELVDLPHERVRDLRDLVELAARLRASQGYVLGQVLLDEGTLRGVGAHELAAQAHTEHRPHLRR